jgi:phosphotriesterase-related protein
LGDHDLKIESVQGPIDTENLGFTLMHEHVMTVNWGMRMTFNNWIDRDTIISNAVNQLTKAKQLGLKTIVDATPINLGRDINILHEVAEKSGVQIIAATGLYYTEEPFLSGWKPEKIAEQLATEACEGIQGTGIKPGIIKCATNAPSISDANRKLLQSTALLHKMTGLPVTTHSSSMNKNGLAQQMILLDEGVKPEKLIIGHCGETTDLGYLESLLCAGSYIGLDRFGLDDLCPMKGRVDTLFDLCSKGYERQIVMSHDYNSYIDWWPQDVFSGLKEVNWPRWSYHHIMEDVLPFLMDRGVSERLVSVLLVDNPRRIFS